MGGVTINWEPGAAKRARREQAIEIAFDLMNRGVEPDTVNSIAAHFLRTGEYKLPTMQTKALPYDPSVPEGRSTQIPLRFKKTTSFYMPDADGKFTQVAVDEDNDLTKVVNPTKPKATGGVTIYVDKDTGNEIRREPRSDGKEVIVKVGKPGGGKGGAGKDSPDVSLAKDTIKKYISAVQKGEEIPGETLTTAQSAADLLGINLEQAINDPTWFQKIQAKASAATGGRIPAPAAPTKKTSGAVDFRAAPTNAQFQKDLELARRYIQQSGNSPDARKEALRRLRLAYPGRAIGL